MMRIGFGLRMTATFFSQHHNEQLKTITRQSHRQIKRQKILEKKRLVLFCKFPKFLSLFCSPQADDCSEEGLYITHTPDAGLHAASSTASRLVRLAHKTIFKIQLKLY